MDYKGLLEPQKAHAKNLLNSIYLNGCADDFSETGCGKTFVACWVAKQLNCPVVVICPNPVKKVWRDTLALFNLDNVLIINYEKLVRGNTPYLEYDLKKFHATPAWWLSEGVKLNFRQDAFIILDEEHKGRGQFSLINDLFVALKNAKYKILGLSASAATSVADMKAIGYKANLHTGENFSSWCSDFGGRLNQYGSIDWTGDQTKANEGMAKIHDNLFNVQRIASRMKRDDFGDIFPENRVFADVFDIGVNAGKLQTVYDNMQYELAMLDKRSQNYSQHVFAIMIKARRHAELLKTPTMVDWIEDMYDEGISPVVFTNFNDTVDALTARLGKKKKFKDKIGYLVGGQKDETRFRDIELFQCDKKRIFIANIAAGCAGISLHDINGNFPRHSLINPSWVAVNILQALGRIHRASGKTPCIQRFFYAANTIEEKIADRMKKRLDNLDMLNDNELQVNFTL